MINADKILCDAALYLDLIARLIDSGAPLDSILDRLQDVLKSLDDMFCADLNDDQWLVLVRLYSMYDALRDAALTANRHGSYSYVWSKYPGYGWTVVKIIG